jgi:hypothetical protein
VLKGERCHRRRAARRQGWRKIQAVAAKIVTLQCLLVRRRRLVAIGVRYRAQLGNEQRQSGKDCDAKFNAMRRF